MFYNADKSPNDPLGNFPSILVTYKTDIRPFPRLRANTRFWASRQHRRVCWLIPSRSSTRCDKHTTVVSKSEAEENGKSVDDDDDYHTQRRFRWWDSDELTPQKPTNSTLPTLGQIGIATPLRFFCRLYRKKTFTPMILHFTKTNI